MRTLAILPVKGFSRGKRRLEPSLDTDLRRELAEAMARDVLNALRRAAVDDIVVVSGDEAVCRLACEQGARALVDDEQGHSQAAMLGVREALGDRAERVLLVPGDCPTLDADELDVLLATPRPPPSVVIVPDRHGTGTNALLLSPPDALAPSFGPGSCKRHADHAEAAGVPFEVVEVPSLALDVDTAEDLAAVADLGARAPRTHELLARC